jgi:uncharacterized protein
MKTARKAYSRRQFLSRTVGGIAGAGLVGISPKTLRAAEPKPPESFEGKPATRKLGKTGIEIPIVSMGVMNADIPGLIRRSFEIGVRHFDTAAGYQNGRNEEMVGSVIDELKARNQVVIGTKVGYHLRPGMDAGQVKEGFLTAVDGCLKRLKTGYIDILYIHNVKDAETLKNPGLLEALAQAKQEGKARFVGFSTHSNMALCLDEAAASGRFDVVLSAINYAMHGNRQLLQSMENAAAKGIGIIAMKTQCQQTWYREQQSADAQGFYEGPILHKALLKWVLSHDFITTAIPGYVNFPQLEEDVSVAFRPRYTPDEKRFLQDRKVLAAIRSVCQQCGGCRSTCPQGADVPELVRSQQYAAAYGNFTAARECLDSIPAGDGLSVCRSCGECVARCVNRVDIGRRIGDLRTIYG